MHRLTRTVVLLALTLAVAVTTVPAAPAHAARAAGSPTTSFGAKSRSDSGPRRHRSWIVIWNTGRKAFVSGPLPAAYRDPLEAEGWQAGYHCKVTGIFWSDVSVRDCTAAAVRGDEVIDRDPRLVAAIEAEYPPSSIRRSFWNHYGWVIILAAVLVAVGGSLTRRFRRRAGVVAAPPVGTGGAPNG